MTGEGTKEIVGQITEIRPELPTTFKINRPCETYQTCIVRDVNNEKDVYFLYIASDVSASHKFKEYIKDDILHGLIVTTTPNRNGKRHVIVNFHPTKCERKEDNGNRWTLNSDD